MYARVRVHIPTFEAMSFTLKCYGNACINQSSSFMQFPSRIARGKDPTPTHPSLPATDRVRAGHADNPVRPSWDATLSISSFFTTAYGSRRSGGFPPELGNRKGRLISNDKI